MNHGFRRCKRQLEGAEGLPIAIQVAGLPYQDETVLRVMALLETDANTTRCPPGIQLGVLPKAKL